MTPSRTIHFILAANSLGSQTRVTVEFVNQLAQLGHKVLVSVPRFDYLDFVLWHLDRQRRQGIGWLRMARELTAWLLLPTLRSRFDRKPWRGETLHHLDPRVQVRRFWLLPTAANLPDADAIVVLQVYLAKHLIGLPDRKGKLFGSIRLDFQSGMQDVNEEIASWRSYCHSFHQTLRIPLFAISRSALRGAQQTGVEIDTVIHNGMNTREFTDGGRRGVQKPIRITLFTDPHPQKGLEFGCSVIQQLRERVPTDAVEIVSAGGPVPESFQPLFDQQLGYLTGSDYVQMFQATDIFIFPALYDGFPAVPLEAMASGCALVTTRVPGPDEYGQQGINCMLVEPGVVDKAVEAVEQLVQDVALRDSIRQGGIKTAQSHSWERAAHHLIDFVEGHLGDSKDQLEATQAELLGSAG